MFLYMYYLIFVPAHVIKVWPYLEGKKGDLGVAKIPRMTKATILSHVIFFPFLYTERRKGIEWILSPWAKTISTNNANIKVPVLQKRKDLGLVKSWSDLQLLLGDHNPTQLTPNFIFTLFCP